MLRALEMMQDDLTDRDATLCFVWSRMCVIDPRTRLGHMKESHLPFEGFLEALCRLAILKALPTDYEISEGICRGDEMAELRGCEDAGEYLARLLDDAPGEYQELMLERATPWGDEPDQPVCRCVAHLLSLIVRLIKREIAAEVATPLTEQQIIKWAKRKKIWQGAE